MVCGASPQSDPGSSFVWDFFPGNTSATVRLCNIGSTGQRHLRPRLILASRVNKVQSPRVNQDSREFRCISLQRPTAYLH